MRFAILFLLLALGLPPSMGGRSAYAAELLMLEQPGCVWCRRWNEEIGTAYPMTDEGRRAPLRRVDITEDWPQDLAGIQKERLTPTFILVDGGVEVDRLRGYPGEHFFWPLLGGMLEKIPRKVN